MGARNPDSTNMLRLLQIGNRPVSRSPERYTTMSCQHPNVLMQKWLRGVHRGQCCYTSQMSEGSAWHNGRGITCEV
jgi:hypothetical protein